MSVKWRVNLTLLAVGVVAIGLSGWSLHVSLTKQAYDDVRRESLQQMATAQAVRSYTTDHVRDLLLKDSREFHSPAIPSYAAMQTMAYLKTTYPGYTYQEVAINPTNPRNEAKGWTRDVVEEFRRDGGAEIFRSITSSGKTTFHYAKPIRVNQSSCLACHGQAEAAPATMLTKYGSKNGFGWNVGEIVGAQIVSVPADAALAKVNQTFAYYLTACGASVFALLAALNVMLSNTVLKPIQSNADALKKLASEDGLTGAANRRSFIESFESEVSGREGSDSPISLVMIDLDHFKRINDTHGHSAGDMVLKECCIRVRHKIRRGDLLGRLGGEEFAVMLPHTDEAGALALASNLLAAIRGMPFDSVGTVTASMGVAQWEPGERVSDVLERADAALYASKHDGRDRVTRAKPR